jgi:hypothetical protein
MILLALLFGKKKPEEPKTTADYDREKLTHFGRGQFQKMIKLGLGSPVSLI